MKLHELCSHSPLLLSIEHCNQGTRFADPSQGGVDQVIEIIAVRHVRTIPADLTP
jgi:hypothetical protein